MPTHKSFVTIDKTKKSGHIHQNYRHKSTNSFSKPASSGLDRNNTILNDSSNHSISTYGMSKSRAQLKGKDPLVSSISLNNL